MVEIIISNNRNVVDYIFETLFTNNDNVIGMKVIIDGDLCFNNLISYDDVISLSKGFNNFKNISHSDITQLIDDDKYSKFNNVFKQMINTNDEYKFMYDININSKD